jgi:signal transduction histidine kinase
MAERRSGADRRRPRGRDADALRTIIERMADGLLVVGRDGVIRFANPAADQLFGRSVEELRGRYLGVPAVVGDSTEIDVVRPGGEIVTAELRAAGADWEGEPATLVSLRDITDRKSLEVERVARARAEAANRAKSEFLTLMSHELRTPLNAVIGYAELLGLGVAGPVTGEQRAQLERIRASGKHLLKLVDEMLDLAEAGEGRLALRSADASALGAASDALGEAESNAASRGIHLSRLCVGDADAMFTGDERRVRQILLQLLDNAIKFTPRGGRVEIECGIAAIPDGEARVRGAGPWVYWRVADSGVGIPPERLASIFDPFVQVEGGHTRTADGSGLGLTISRSLARLMHGDLTVRSEVGRGSWFTLWLPAVVRS